MKRKAGLAASFVVTLVTFSGCAKPKPETELTHNPPQPPTVSADSGATPASVTADASTASAEDDGTTWGEHIVPTRDGKCYKHAGGHCPKGAHCNPPPPRLIDCPDGGSKK